MKRHCLLSALLLFGIDFPMIGNAQTSSAPGEEVGAMIGSARDAFYASQLGAALQIVNVAAASRPSDLDLLDLRDRLAHLIPLTDELTALRFTGQRSGTSSTARSGAPGDPGVALELLTRRVQREVEGIKGLFERLGLGRAGGEAVAAPAPPASAAAGGRRLSLPPQTPGQARKHGTSKFLVEMNALLTPFGTPKVSLEGDDSIILYKGVTYLTPVVEARRQLGLHSHSSLFDVATPGLPGGLMVHSFDGRFEFDANRLYLIVDNSSQVVMVQLVVETPKTFLRRGLQCEGDWHVYNFINARQKAKRTLVVYNYVSCPTDLLSDDSAGRSGYGSLRVGERESAMTIQQAVASRKMLCLATTLYDSDAKSSSNRFKEASYWYIPQPIIDMILFSLRY